MGLTLEAGEWHQAWGALLLFLTNVAAILLTGVIVMSIFGVPREAIAVEGRTFHRQRAIGIVVALVMVIAVPLSAATVRLTRTSSQQAAVGRVAQRWAESANWLIVEVVTGAAHTTILASGPDPAPDPATLRTMLDQSGLSHASVTLRLVPEQRIDLPGH